MPLCFFLIYAFLSSHDVALLLFMLTNPSHAPLHFRLDDYQLFTHSLCLVLQYASSDRQESATQYLNMYFSGRIPQLYYLRKSSALLHLCVIKAKSECTKRPSAPICSPSHSRHFNEPPNYPIDIELEHLASSSLLHWLKHSYFSVSTRLIVDLDDLPVK